MIKLSFLGDIMCLKAQNDAVMKKHGEYRYDGYLSGLAPLLKDSNYVGSVEKYWGCFFCFIVFCIFAL